MEDIINRGGGDLVIQLFESNEDGSVSDKQVTVYSDGRTYKAEAGAIVRLKVGESITLPCGQYHKFWGEGGTVLVGEVSIVNVDTIHNNFADPKGRFPTIDEDEQPYLYLFNEIPQAK